MKEGGRTRETVFIGENDEGSPRKHDLPSADLHAPNFPALKPKRLSRLALKRLNLTETGRPVALYQAALSSQNVERDV